MGGPFSFYAELMSIDPEAVLITGLYGTGKSSVVEEMAGILDLSTSSYALLDLDYLWWFQAEELDDAGHRDVLWANLASLIDNYLAIGVGRFLLAWTAEDKTDLDELARTIAMPMRVFILSVPLPVIQERLSLSPATDRQRDLRNTERLIAENRKANFDGVVVDNDRPLTVVARELLVSLNWV